MNRGAAEMQTSMLDLINRRYGKLTVKRDLGDDLYHCECDCGRSRTVSREQLTGKAIECCFRCAAENRRNACRKRPRMPEPLPEPKPVELPCVGCYTKDGWFHVQPDCPKHGIVRIDPYLGQREESVYAGF